MSIAGDSIDDSSDSSASVKEGNAPTEKESHQRGIFPAHFYSGISFVVCRFPGCDDSTSPALLRNVDEATKHLLDCHNLLVQDVNGILPAFEEYFTHYAQIGVGERSSQNGRNMSRNGDAANVPMTREKTDSCAHDPEVASMLASMVAVLGIDVEHGAVASLGQWPEGTGPPSQDKDNLPLNEPEVASPTDSTHFSSPPVILGPSSPSFSSDSELRAALVRRAALSALAQWERERREEWKRKCIFCKEVVEGRSEWWRHLSTVHSFYLGTPDNLLSVSDLVDTLSRMVQRGECPRCRRLFRDKGALRRHMRKKRHGSVDGRDKEWDRFFLSNYTRLLQPATSTRLTEIVSPSATFSRSRPVNSSQETPPVTDNSDDDDGSEAEETFSDWLSTIDEPTSCLFHPSHVLSSPAEAWRHMELEHGWKWFGKEGVKIFWAPTTYSQIRLVNYVRRHTSLLTCFACLRRFSNSDELAEHFSESEHATVKGGSRVLVGRPWEDDRYLIPTYDGDPLLSEVGGSEDDEAE
ncbi:hypothetical protein M427DRAFT_155024 [Gonapodya prolifera JEL478]|uniref:C2H2-type domain-containing protein n=1 Tax=Gonapodya prolifera (strain JEL478) TaxID=1344416 RepID=A0A139AHR4_GONPJ|nr:hypothetical protein M427DRAFT_155024 [Gonapodya prolifera JEL478]|eukprot:KXS15975.1 hypothetical protein M427DRAFT_155024 [Gonapodya prolifera JEL478]